MTCFQFYKSLSIPVLHENGENFVIVILSTHPVRHTKLFHEQNRLDISVENKYVIIKRHVCKIHYFTKWQKTNTSKYFWFKELDTFKLSTDSLKIIKRLGKVVHIELKTFDSLLS